MVEAENTSGAGAEGTSTDNPYGTAASAESRQLNVLRDKLRSVHGL